jgi:hypothetical protein
MVCFIWCALYGVLSIWCALYGVLYSSTYKFHPRTGHEGPEGEKLYSFTLSLTSALDRVGGQRHAPTALPPGETRYPLYRRLGWPQIRSEQVRKILPPPVFDPRTVHPRSESLYRLSYPGSSLHFFTYTNC